MATAFDFLWTAFIFFFDVRIGGFYVLPDVVGYLLLAIGLWRIASLDRHLAIAARLAPFTAMLSLADIYCPPAKGASLVTFGGPTFQTPLGIALVAVNIVLTALNVVIVHQMLTGLMAAAKKKKETKITNAATSLLGEYKALHGVLAALVLLAAAVPTIVWIGSLAQYAVGFVTYIPMMSLLRDTQWYLFGMREKAST